MSQSFTERDVNDLTQLYRIHDFSKVKQAAEIAQDAEKKGKSPEQLFKELFGQYHIAPLPNRAAVAEHLRREVPSATAADVESVLRLTEMKSFTEKDALRSLKRMCGMQQMSTYRPSTAEKIREESGGELQHTMSSLRHIERAPLETQPPFTETVKVAETDHLTSPKRSKESMDAVIAQEVRDWVIEVVGPRFDTELKESANFVDALRNGVVLQVLAQKLRTPPIEDDKISVPRRTSGFFMRDNVAAFLIEVKQRFELLDAQLFTDSDLCDAKDDRQVVTCLMSVARIAYNRGFTKVAPAIVIYEREIAQSNAVLTSEDIDRIVREAEAAKYDNDVQQTSFDDESIVPSVGMPWSSHDASHLSSPKNSAASRDIFKSEPKPTDEPAPAAPSEAEPRADQEEPPSAANPVVSPTQEHTSTSPTQEPATEPEPAVVQPEDVCAADVQLDSPKEAPAAAEEAEGESEAVTGGGTAGTQEFAPSEGGSQHAVDLRSDAVAKNTSTPEMKPDEGARLDAIIWKQKPSDLGANRPPHYNSRRWDGIDVALGSLLNAHYEKYPASPWRFHGMASNAGEYVVYSRQSAEKHLLHARLIQNKLLLHLAKDAKSASWVDFTEMMEDMEKKEAAKSQ